MANPPDTERSVAPEHDPTAGPGRRLRKAREAAHLTQEEVAVQLHIEPRIIAALERDDAAQLPPAVFVRGYLRGYARLVGIPVEPLIAIYDRLVAHEPPPLVLPTPVGPEMEPRTTRSRWRLPVFVVLVLLLLYAWWNQRTPEKPVTPPVTVQQPADTVPLPEQPAPLPEAEPPVPGADYTAPHEEPAEPAPVPGPSEAAPPPPTKPATPAPGPETRSPGSETPVTPPTETPAATSPPLVLRFNAASWVDIRDASGRKLLQGLIGAGTTQALDGAPPFRLTLGNSPAVEVEYRGQRFDQSRYNGPDRVARFSLGE